MRSSDTLNELAGALVKAHKKLKNPSRTKSVKVASKRTGKTYTFKYAPMEDILDQVRPILQENGLSLLQVGCEGGCETILVHTSGQFISGVTPVRASNGDSQEYGSALTYARRYGLISILGLAADDDDDGNHADGNHVEDQPKSTTRTLPPDPPKDEGPRQFKLPEERLRGQAALLAQEMMRVTGSKEGASDLWFGYLEHEKALRDAPEEVVREAWIKLIDHPEYGSEVGF